MAKEAVVLVGHGGVPSDLPSELVSELKRLEAQRRASGAAAMSPREADLDRRVRTWPRSAATDPYQAGLEAVAARLAPRVAPRRLAIAYNEFCAPSVEDAIAELVREGFDRITLATTMFTPGGSHSEQEIPEIVREARAAHPGVDIRYAWPFDLDRAADFLAEQIARA
jgi:sirohydrochlorin cobaltochelatase